MNSLLAWYIIGGILGLFLIGFEIWFGICVVSILNDISDSLENFNQHQATESKHSKKENVYEEK